MSDGVALRAGARRVWLKWHQLRHAAEDPAHDRANLRLGIARGASLEVDLVLTRDGHFVCLHDDQLAAETTGEGLVRDHGRAALERLRQCDNQRRPLATPPLFLDEVVDALAAAPADWSGRLQLDLKPPSAPFDDAVIRRFGALVAPVAQHLMLGGTRWRPVLDLGRAVPGLRLGFDPLDLHEVAPPASPAEFGALGAYTLAHADAARIFYFHIPLLLRGLAAGVDLIALAKGRGAEVDAWRLEPGHERAGEKLRRLVAAGVDQITTDAPEGLERLWQTRPA
jgi:glycerophosphoryl diester phosphodiesterase